MDKETPVGFKAVRLRIAVESDAAPQDLERLLRLTERYCVVYQTLRNKPELDVSLEREAGK